MDDQFRTFLKFLDEQYIGEICCLFAQLILTIITAVNLYKHSQDFPIKQLSPISTFVASLCFLMTNVVSLIGLIIENKNKYYDQNICQGQCRLHNHSEMIILAIIYNGLRDLPFIIFAMKTCRVCICYWDKFYLSKNPSKIIVFIFKNQLNLLTICLIHTLLVESANLLVLLQGGITPQNGSLLFQFFCPKESSILDYVINIERFFLLGFVYFLSIWTYKQLDFKKFLLFLFVGINSQVILRICLFVGDYQDTTYHEFYYHSFLIQLLGSLLLAIFSRAKQKVNQPPNPLIFQQWNAFINVQLCFKVIGEFAQHLDNITNTKRYTQNFKRFLDISQLIKLSIINKKLQLPHKNNLSLILSQIKDQQNQQIVCILKKKNKQELLELAELRQIQKILTNFCIKEIFKPWMETCSYKNMKIQFEKNSQINDKLYILNISID